MEFLKANARRIVVKIGTNSLVAEDGALRRDRLAACAKQIRMLRDRGLQVTVVSSGAIGAGLQHLGMKDRPADLASLQACAAVGQPVLMAAWSDALANFGMRAAQVLLTRDDVQGRKRHLAARGTMERILELGAVPVVNENDTISVDEIRFGDNDVLSALVASLIKADLLVILSTIPGLMEDQGRGALIPVVESITPEIKALAGGARDSRSTGGMVTKLEAARLATSSGCGTFIGSAEDPAILNQILSGNATGTFFLPSNLSLAARKRWIAFFERSHGELHLDAGAVAALTARKTSLLAPGIRSCNGNFDAGDVVTLHSPSGEPFARGRSSFNSSDLSSLLGLSKDEIHRLHPTRSRTEVIHRDSLVLLPR